MIAKSNHARGIAAAILAALCAFALVGCQNVVDGPDMTLAPGDAPTGTPDAISTPDPWTIEGEVDYSQFDDGSIPAKNPWQYLFDNPDGLDIQQYPVGETVEIGGMTVRAMIARGKSADADTVWELYMRVDDVTRQLGTLEIPFDISWLHLSLTAIDFEGDGFDPYDLMIYASDPYALTFMYGGGATNPYLGRIYRVTASGGASALYNDYSAVSGARYIYPEYSYDGETLVLKDDNMAVSNHYSPLHDNAEWHSFNVLEDFEVIVVSEGESSKVVIPAGADVILGVPPNPHGAYGEALGSVFCEDIEVYAEALDIRGYVNYEWLKGSGCIDGDITVTEYLVMTADYEFDMLTDGGDYAKSVLSEGTLVRFVTYNPYEQTVIFETYEGERGMIYGSEMPGFNTTLPAGERLFCGGSYPN